MLSSIHASKNDLDEWKSVWSSRVIILKSSKVISYDYINFVVPFSKNFQCDPRNTRDGKRPLPILPVFVKVAEGDLPPPTAASPLSGREVNLAYYSCCTPRLYTKLLKQLLFIYRAVPTKERT